MRKIGGLLILFYKRFISPTLAGVFYNRCIYTPSCSVYTYDAISKYGLVRGSFKGLRRILRCTPFRKGGFDPVRENYRGKLKWML